MKAKGQWLSVGYAGEAVARSEAQSAMPQITMYMAGRAPIEV